MIIQGSLALTTKASMLIAMAAGLPAFMLVLAGLTASGLLMLSLIPIWIWFLRRLLMPIVRLADELSVSRLSMSSPYGDAAANPEAAAIRLALVERQAQAELQAALREEYQSLYLTLADSIPVGVLRLDGEGRPEYANAAFSDMTGVQLSELQEGDWDRIIDPDDREFIKRCWRELATQTQATRSVRIVHSDGSRRWLELRIETVEQTDRTPVYLVLLQDLTTQKRALDLLHLERRKALALFDSVSDGVILTDENDVVQYLNPAAQQLTGKGPEEVVGRALAASIRLRVATESEGFETGSAHAVPARASAVLENESDELRPIKLSIALIRDEDAGQGAKLVVFRPLREGGEVCGERDTNHDWLTGLASRQTFERVLEDTLKQGGMRDTPVVVALVDLDHFRQVNEDGGRSVGDEMLKQVAAILMNNVRRCDLVARLGGDEFGLLLTGCDSLRAMSIIEGIRADLERYHLDAESGSFHVTASIGVTEFMPSDASVQTVLRRADEGCYRSKAQGRNLVNLVQVAA